ncbi:sugar ABC transporter permease [Deinococcus marmoris]|uniref:Xylose transport system permease protein XylH n=1 Tax=Deinococcus marmoris TaxID=249408 RepID=A0A1U7NT16_9DEIO|nr:sugar ABC transporter permease [Deinococcus marmoris]OLV16051.1 Xylose ABC transporter, permease protein XylH [Deinococcus marmoris]
MQSVKTVSTTPPKRLLAQLGLDGRLLFMVLAIAGIWIAFNLLTGGVFITSRNLWNLSVQTASVGVMVSGMVLIIVMRNIDLSIGSILGFTGMAMAVLNIRVFPQDTWWSALLTLALGLLLGLGIGMLQGTWVALLGVPSFIVTLGGLLIFRGGAWLLTSGQTVAPLTETFQILGGGLNGSIGGPASWGVGALIAAAIVWTDLRNYQQRARRGLPNRTAILQFAFTGVTLALVLAFVLVMNSYPDPRSGLARGIPVPVLIMLAVTAVMMWVVRATRFGRYVFAYGGNPEAARLAGINTTRLTILVFGIMGMLAALAGAIQTARLNAGTNSTGTLAELSVIAAAVIGGTSLAGGTGSIPGAFLGAILMASLINGMLLLDLPSAWQNVVQGLVLMLAVTLDGIFQRRRAK